MKILKIVFATFVALFSISSFASNQEVKLTKDNVQLYHEVMLAGIIRSSSVDLKLDWENNIDLYVRGLADYGSVEKLNDDSKSIHLSAKLFNDYKESLQKHSQLYDPKVFAQKNEERADLENTFKYAFVVLDCAIKRKTNNISSIFKQATINCSNVTPKAAQIAGNYSKLQSLANGDVGYVLERFSRSVAVAPFISQSKYNEIKRSTNMQYGSFFTDVFEGKNVKDVNKAAAYVNMYYENRLMAALPDKTTQMYKSLVQRNELYMKVVN